MSSMALSCKRCECGGSLGVPLEPPAEVFLRVEYPALQLGRGDDGAAHAAHHVALRVVGGGDRDHPTGAGRLVGDALDDLVGRMAPTSENDSHALHQLLCVGAGSLLMRVEDHRHLSARD